MKKVITLCFTTSIFAINTFAQTGEELYKTTCARCHTIGNGQLVGPDLKGKMNQYSEKWLVKWIRSSQTLIKDGDKKAKELYEQFNEIEMPDNNLPDDQIKSIIAYVKQQGGEATVADASVKESKTIPSETTQDKKLAETSTSTAPSSQEKSTASVTAAALAISEPTITEKPKQDDTFAFARNLGVENVVILFSGIVVIIAFLVMGRTILILISILKEKVIQEAKAEKTQPRKPIESL